MKNLILVTVLVASFGALAATNTAAKVKLTPQQRALEALKRSGGMIVEPNSGKGFVAVVNTQSKVDEKEIAEVVAVIRKEISYRFKIVKTDVEAKDAALTIRVVDVAGKPVFTASPEASLAEVNVATLVDDLKSDFSKKKFLPHRTRIEIMRAFAYAAGAGGSGFPGNIFDTVTVKDLDYCKEFFPVDTLDAIRRHLTKRGLEPENVTTYRYACEEGWAPAPTNEYQKAIYEEIKNPEKRWDKDFGGQKK